MEQRQDGTVSLSCCTGALHSSLSSLTKLTRAVSNRLRAGVERLTRWKRGGPALPEGSPQFSLAGGQVQHESVRGSDASSMLQVVDASSARARRELGASCSRTWRELGASSARAVRTSRMKTFSNIPNILGRPSRSTSTSFPKHFHSIPMHFIHSSLTLHSLFTLPFPLPTPHRSESTLKGGEDVTDRSVSVSSPFTSRFPFTLSTSIACLRCTACAFSQDVSCTRARSLSFSARSRLRQRTPPPLVCAVEGKRTHAQHNALARYSLCMRTLVVLTTPPPLVCAVEATYTLSRSFPLAFPIRPQRLASSPLTASIQCTHHLY